jgi:hypothetical protein
VEYLTVNGQRYPALRKRFLGLWQQRTVYRACAPAKVEIKLSSVHSHFYLIFWHCLKIQDLVRKTLKNSGGSHDSENIFFIDSISTAEQVMSVFYYLPE